MKRNNPSPHSACFTAEPAAAAAPALDPEQIAAVLNSDPAYDGQFYYGVTTTGIFCRPSCKSKNPKPEHLRFFNRREDALTAGFRPCKRCRPDLQAYAPDQAAAEALYHAIDQHFTDQDQLPGLITAMGAHQPSIKAAFTARYGQSPKALIQQQRLSLAADGLLNSNRAVLEIALSSGFSSQSAFYAAFKKAYQTSPGAYRKARREETTQLNY